METKWYFNENDQDIEIPMEEWGWHVIYKDGSELHQFDRTEGADGKRRFHQFKEINQSEVVVFEMINTASPKLRHGIDVSGEGMDQIFHFYRRSRLNIGTEAETHITFYCFGYRLNGVSVYHFILPNHRLVITTNRNLQLVG